MHFCKIPQSMGILKTSNSSAVFALLFALLVRTCPNSVHEVNITLTSRALFGATFGSIFICQY